MVVIKKHNNIIPVDFGEFVINFVASDSNLKKLDRITKELKENKLDYDTELDEAGEIAKKYWTELFGEEVYKKVLDFAEGSSITLLLYLGQTIKGITEEFGANNNKDVFEKYM